MNETAPLICKIALKLLLFPLLSVSLMSPSLKSLKMSLCVLFRNFARPRSVTSGHPHLVTSCLLMSGLCRTCCISLGTETTRIKFTLLASSRINRNVLVGCGVPVRDATYWRCEMPYCVHATSQRLHLILSSCKEDPIAYFMAGIPIGIWIPFAVCDCKLEWR